MTEESWNWCPYCNQLVDADDVHDGTEVQCWGCDRVFVCVFGRDINGGEYWWLTEVEGSDDEDDER